MRAVHTHKLDDKRKIFETKVGKTLQPVGVRVCPFNGALIDNFFHVYEALLPRKNEVIMWSLLDSVALVVNWFTTWAFSFSSCTLKLSSNDGELCTLTRRHLRGTCVLLKFAV